MGSYKLSNFVCHQVGWYLTSLMDVIRDTMRATHGLSVKAFTWKTALGRGRTRPNSLIVSWTVATHGAQLFDHVMLSSYYRYKVDYWFESPQHPRKWVMAWSLSQNVEFNFILYCMFTLWMLINTCFGHLCILRLRYKPSHVNQLKMANNLLNRC
jgi:hypothetical protein